MAALVATNGKLQKNAAHAEGEHHLAASLLETFNARLVALKLANDKTSAAFYKGYNADISVCYPWD